MLKAALEQARQGMLDNVESAFYAKVLGGDTTAMIFWLKTQGKRRGWVERTEVEHSGANGVPIVTTMVVECASGRTVECEPEG